MIWRRENSDPTGIQTLTPWSSSLWAVTIPTALPRPTEVHVFHLKISERKTKKMVVKGRGTVHTKIVSYFGIDYTFHIFRV
jgi:hypothetical protein